LTDYYALLGVPRDATETEIRSAYGRDALRLNEISAPPEQHAILRAALTALVDPAARAEYDAQLATSALMATAQNEAGDASYRYARAGAIWFAGGCAVTAATYLAAGDGGGRFFIAWGAVIFGAIQLIRGLASYLGSGAARTQTQMLTLAGIVLVGVLSGGWVVADQVAASADRPTIDAWNAALDEAQALTDKAETLMDQVASRSDWTAQDNSDLAQVSTLYGRAADRLAAAPIVTGHEWYREGLVKDFREASAVAGEMSRIGGTATKAQVDSLSARWDAWVQDYNSLADRFDASRRR